MRIAICLPYFDRPKRIYETLRSIVDAKGDIDVEIFIADEGSSVQPDPNWSHLMMLYEEGIPIHLLQSPRNLGIGHARYTSVEMARSLGGGPFDYYCFWDDDFQIKEGYFERLTGALRMYPNIGMVGGCDPQLMSGWKGYDPVNPWETGAPYENSMVTHRTLEMVGNFDSRLWYYEDTDIVIKLRKMGKKFCIIPDAPTIQKWRNEGGLQSSTGSESGRETLKAEMGEILVRKHEGFVHMEDPEDPRPVIHWDKLDAHARSFGHFIGGR